VRRSDNVVKPDAFIPHPCPDLSVTRHLSATEQEVWALGDAVAAATNKSVYGRADVIVKAFDNQSLTAVPDPIPGNPNHAVVNGWPLEKPQQKMAAIEIAKVAQFVALPQT
jgi:hypothetical protein